MDQIAARSMRKLSAVAGEVTRVTYADSGDLFALDVPSTIAEEIIRDGIELLYAGDGPFPIQKRRRLKSGQVRFYVGPPGAT